MAGSTTRRRSIFSRNDRRSTGNAYAPSISAARISPVYRERLRTFDQRRPHLSRDMDVSAEEIRDIMAYVETLERP
jgi:hypothetical protein